MMLVMLRVCAIPEGLVSVVPMSALSSPSSRSFGFSAKSGKRCINSTNWRNAASFRSGAVPGHPRQRVRTVSGPLRELRKLCIVRRGAALFLAADMKGAHGSLYE